MIASESQITRSPCLRIGTLPAGECLRSSRFDPGSDSRTSTSSKGTPAARAARKPRSDQDE